MTRELLLEARDIVVIRGGTRVLDIASLVLHEKEVLSLIGPNGAGKSSLLLTLASLLRPSGGELRCRGELLVTKHSTDVYRRRMSMVFQEPLLFDTSVFDNVATGLRIRGMGRSEIRTLVGESLELFNILPLADRSARRLSGGEAQRVSLARAFAIKPELLLLDEPFSSLDPPTRLALTEDLDHILKQTGTAAIIATHDQMEALQLSDRMAVMNGGRIVQCASPVEVTHRPADEFVASFVGMENVLSGQVTAHDKEIVTVSIAGHPVKIVGMASAGDDVLFCIRPENITIETTDHGATTSARNVFHGLIGKITHLGAYHKVCLDCGFPLVTYLTSQAIDTLHLEEGKTVYASFKATAVHLIRSGS